MLYVKFDNFDEIAVMGNKRSHGMFIPIKDDNIYQLCERCGSLEKVKEPCEIIASSIDIKSDFSEGYELCDRCKNECDFIIRCLKNEK